MGAFRPLVGATWCGILLQSAQKEVEKWAAGSMGWGHDGSIPDTQLQAHGVVQIRPGQEFVGELTAWPQAAWLWHERLLEPLDAYTVNVQQYFRFGDPLPVNAALSEEGHVAESPNSFRPIMIPCLPPAVWDREGMTSTTHTSLKVALEEWGLRVDGQHGRPKFGIRLESLARDNILRDEWS